MLRQLIPVALATLVPGVAPSSPEPVRFTDFRYAGHDATFDTIPHGHYANPILPGFYPDPSVIRVGRWFYLVNSTFSYFPGLPVFRSSDLVHWVQIGNAIDRPGQIDLTGRGLSEGLFAPALHYAGGLFYIINTCVGCGGTFVVSARDPAGPWSDPVWIREVGGIDPSLFTDADGSTWLVNNDASPEAPRYDGHRAIWIRRFDLATLKVAGPAIPIVDGGIDPAARPVWVEGPHLFRHDGHYYLITAEGGTSTNHSETVYRASRPNGPFVPWPRPILTQRDLPPGRPAPITSAGHAQLVNAGAAGWWAVFLATRPYAGDLYNTGRETFLLPVTWRAGWPVVTEPGTTIPYAVRRPALPTPQGGRAMASGNAVTDDTFVEPSLATTWLMVRTPKTQWWHTGRGGLRLDPRTEPIGGTGQPSFLGHRQQHMHAQATTTVSVAAMRNGAKAGLVAYQNEAHYYFIGMVQDQGRRQMRVERRAGSGDPIGGAILTSTPLPDGVGGPGSPVQLRIAADGGRYTFDYATAPGRWVRLLGDADGTVLSTARAGGFVGTTIGPYAYSP
ncbi:glycoside hydrolase family 43 protein [Sphingomonas sp. XXL09]|uniref:glycoside hydrolase family 43 protein n=1 Tax=Sphingomonas sp. XXL09 TaxID=3457787 RepID=UPI00406BCF4D